MSAYQASRRRADPQVAYRALSLGAGVQSSAARSLPGGLSDRGDHTVRLSGAGRAVSWSRKRTTGRETARRSESRRGGMSKEKRSGEPIVSAGRLAVLAHTAVAQWLGRDGHLGLFVDGSWVDRSEVASREQVRASRRGRRG